MHVLKRNPWLTGLGALLTVLVVYGGHARADVTTDQPGSIIIFPKVVVDASRDTFIQITNTSNMAVAARCNYISYGTCSLTTTQHCNADSECPLNETCELPCNEQGFDIALTAQQPTVWSVADGRTTGDLPGFFPATVPPQPVGFIGELKCVQIDSSDAPVTSNSLKGEAGIVNGVTGDESVYNAITILGLRQVSPPSCPPNLPPELCPPSNVWELPLDMTPSVAGHYNACPNTLVFNHFVEGATDSFTGATVNTELTLVPCTEDLEDQLPTHGRALFTMTNEFEQSLTGSVNFNCMINTSLINMSSNFGALGTVFAKTRIAVPSGKICASGPNRNQTCTLDTDCCGADLTQCLTTSGGTLLGCRPFTGLLGVAEEFQTSTSGTTSEAYNLHTEGSRPGDLIIVPIP